MACSLSQARLGQSNNHKRKREDDMLKSVHRMLAVAAVSLAALAAGPSVAAEFITVGGGSTGGAFFTISAGMARVIEQNIPDVKATARVTAATTENTRLLGQKKIEFALAADRKSTRLNSSH